MDVVKQQAIEFAGKLKRLATNSYEENYLMTFHRLTQEQLRIHFKLNNKIKFLSHIEHEINTFYQEHSKSCRDPKCNLDTVYETYLYATKDFIDELSINEYGVSLALGNQVKFFEDGQHFDATLELAQMFSRAKKEIKIVDGYINEDTLKLLTGKDENVSVKILSDKKSISEQLQRLIEAFNHQYKNLKIKTTSAFHDRFIIIDGENIFHIGASIKDAGKKAFAYSKISDSKTADKLLKKFENEWNKTHEGKTESNIE